jgi:hypothetical protein
MLTSGLAPQLWLLKTMQGSSSDVSSSSWSEVSPSSAAMEGRFCAGAGQRQLLFCHGGLTHARGVKVRLLVLGAALAHHKRRPRRNIHILIFGFHWACLSGWCEITVFRMMNAYMQC